jgi:hypothetical protein
MTKVLRAMVTSNSDFDLALEFHETVPFVEGQNVVIRSAEDHDALLSKLEGARGLIARAASLAGSFDDSLHDALIAWLAEDGKGET